MLAEQRVHQVVPEPLPGHRRSIEMGPEVTNNKIVKKCKNLG